MVLRWKEKDSILTQEKTNLCNPINTLILNCGISVETMLPSLFKESSGECWQECEQNNYYIKKNKRNNNNSWEKKKNANKKRLSKRPKLKEECILKQGMISRCY